MIVVKYISRRYVILVNNYRINSYVLFKKQSKYISHICVKVELFISIK